MHYLEASMMSMTWLLLATGVTGGMSMVFVLRWLHGWLFTPPSVAVHFSPEGGCTNAVVNELLHARHEILVQAYSFSSKPIAEALIAAKKRGVHVELVMDHSNEQEPYSDLQAFLEAGLNPLIDAKHPARGEPGLAPLANRRGLAQSTARHTVFGAVLGVLS